MQAARVGLADQAPSGHRESRRRMSCVAYDVVRTRSRHAAADADKGAAPIALEPGL